MLIQQKRVRTLKGRLPGINPRDSVVIGAILQPDATAALQKLGFPSLPKEGDSLLPAIIGPVTRFNTLGTEIVHRDKPMETAYRTVEWHWTEWRGPYDSEEQSDFVDVPYKRFPRTRVPPPGVEVKLAVTTKGQRVLVAPPIEFRSEDDPRLLHHVNLLLEIFGYCQVFTSDLDQIIQAPLRRLNWAILRSGSWTWRELKPQLDTVIHQAREGNRPVIAHRFETINGYNPDFVAIGQAGFTGYVVFGFTQRGLYLFESIYCGNATYIFGDDWEKLSKLTKTQVLENNLQKGRVLHCANWSNRLRAVLSPAPDLPR